MNKIKVLLLLLAIVSVGINIYGQCPPSTDSLLIYCVNTQKQKLKFYWKNDNDQRLKNFENLKSWLNGKGQKLVFAMNGGMYKTDNSPLGLFVESGKLVVPINKASASGNFYLKPNGVFAITKVNNPIIATTENFKQTSTIKYATQSGPMLVINGKIHPEFREGSSNVNIRNGVGVLSDGQVIFVMSKKPINFFDFANFFLKSGCKNALYLDGAVSQTYLPGQNWIQLGGNFGVIVAETSTLK